VKVRPLVIQVLEYSLYDTQTDHLKQAQISVIHHVWDSREDEVWNDLQTRSPIVCTGSKVSLSQKELTNDRETTFEEDYNKF